MRATCMLRGRDAVSRAGRNGPGVGRCVAGSSAEYQRAKACDAAVSGTTRPCAMSCARCARGGAEAGGVSRPGAAPPPRPF